RAWLQAGKHIAVPRMPTSFGPISFSIWSDESSVRVSLDVPGRSPLPTLSLRLRPPRGHPPTRATLPGRACRRFDRETGAIALPPREGRLEFDAGVERSR